MSEPSRPEEDGVHSSPLTGGFANGFPPRFSAVTREGEAGAAIDFGIHVLPAGGALQESDARESAWVLLHGRAALEWDGERFEVERRSLFDESPSVLHLGPETRITIEPLTACEWAVARTTNARRFAPRLFQPREVQLEPRGLGLAQGACLRTVRTVFDAASRPDSNLVLGEVVNLPGRWSSYPPHHHAQPEIYHYRFTLPQGYGHAELGDQVLKVHHGDTLRIPPGRTHVQVAAPGYGMWYLWIVRHLPDCIYRGFEYEPEHAWLLDPRQQGWQPRELQDPAGDAGVVKGQA